MVATRTRTYDAILYCFFFASSAFCSARPWVCPSISSSLLLLLTSARAAEAPYSFLYMASLAPFFQSLLSMPCTLLSRLESFTIMCLMRHPSNVKPSRPASLAPSVSLTSTDIWMRRYPCANNRSSSRKHVSNCSFDSQKFGCNIGASIWMDRLLGLSCLRTTAPMTRLVRFCRMQKAASFDKRWKSLDFAIASALLNGPSSMKPHTLCASYDLVSWKTPPLVAVKMSCR
mmetsp:Transcript_21313/g.59237  ORF Transcript_21313/g.59237 Transcript_21313/m.59237 type:complete len:230 (+) Transcript_21313:1597-2286(+)